MDETARALEEHGYFKLLRMLDTSTEAEKQERIERWRIQTQKEHEELVKKFPTDPEITPPDLSISPARLAYSYIVIAKRESL